MKLLALKLLPFGSSILLFFYLYPTESQENVTFLFFKCLPMIALCVFVIQDGLSFHFKYNYSRRILTGLFFSMIGDACLVYPHEYFIFGLISFAIAHVIYFTAFGIKPFNFRLACTLVALSLPVLALYIPFITNYMLKFLVPVYMLLLVSMLWRAVSRLQLFNKDVQWTWTKMCCSIGALLFVISDSALSFDLFVFKLPFSHPIVMSTYYAAQFGIALSMVDSSNSKEVNKLVLQRKDLMNGVRWIASHLKLIYFDDNVEVIDSGMKARKDTDSGLKSANKQKQF